MDVRKVTHEDAQSLLELFIQLDEDTEFMLFEPGERATSLEEQHSIISMFQNDDSKEMLVAESSEICGFCVIVGGPQNRVAHVASLVIGVLKSKWGQGVGSKIMSNALSAAKTMGFSRIELTVNINNSAAINLYKKFGFTVEGERLSALQINGSLVNEYYMAKV